MKQYMFIIRGGQLDNPSPEEMQEEMQKWGVWMGNLAEKGLLVGGEPLDSPAKSFIENGTKVIDRPLAEGKEMVGGYIIVKAENLDQAAELTKGCPGFAHDCSIEVREIMLMEQPA